MKALLLAAGLGTRLRPLTLYRPKPLCLFYGQPLLSLTYQQIRNACLDKIAINSHYLSNQLELHIQQHKELFNPSPTISFEPDILGTGGCLNPIRDWINTEDLLIYNGDTVANIDLTDLIRFHKEGGFLASMVLLQDWKTGTNPVYWSEDKVTQIGGECGKNSQRATFSGVHILSKSFIDSVPGSGFQNIIDTYHQNLAAGGRIGAYIHSGFWADLGNPKDYWRAHRDLLNHFSRDTILDALGYFQLTPKDSLTWDLVRQSAYVNTKQTLEADTSFIFGPIHHTYDVTMQGCIVYPYSQIQPSTVLQSRIITPETNFSIS